MFFCFPQMTKLYQEMLTRKKALEAAAKSGKPKYEYDSDEETEGGTWEHKRRMAEMEATKGMLFVKKREESSCHCGEVLILSCFQYLLKKVSKGIICPRALYL